LGRFAARDAGQTRAGDNRTVGEEDPGVGAGELLPAGTITMLFSDIEGSTALLNRLGERYGEALSAQRELAG
jgi:class 3 adenylate cyclase